MNIAFQAFFLSCLVGFGSCQLFPFSTLHHHALKDMSSTESSPSASVLQVRIETNERPLRQVGSASESLTVLVTPRPKYRPQNFVQEPSVGPNNDSVPSMMDDKSVQERMKTYHHRPYSEKEPADHISRPPRAQHKTIVDSVPSLSVVIPSEVLKNDGSRDQSMDFLRPPRFPSIYKSKPTLADFNTAPLREFTKGSSEHKFLPHKEWHRKPDKKQNFKRKIRGKPTESNIHLKTQIQWAPSSAGTLDTFTHQTPTFHLDPYYEQYAEHVLLEPHSQHTTFKEYEISSDGYISSPIREWTVKPGQSEEEDSTRVNYQLKGHKGPETYKFGYDTGLGKERIFRFEEKDEYGNVKGQYGYYDKYGRLQLVKYVADKDGFRAFPS